MSQRDVFGAQVPSYVLPSTVGALGEVLTVGPASTPNALVWAPGGSSTGIETIEHIHPDASGNFTLFQGDGITIVGLPNGLGITNSKLTNPVLNTIALLTPTSGFQILLYTTAPLILPTAGTVFTTTSIAFSCYTTDAAVLYGNLEFFVNGVFTQVMTVPVGLNRPTQCYGQFSVLNAPANAVFSYSLTITAPSVLVTTADDNIVVDVIAYQI
jgi:hypothetical protein